MLPKKIKRFFTEAWPILIIAPLILALPHGWKISGLWHIGQTVGSWTGEGTSLAPYVPSNPEIIDALLDELAPQTNDLLIDIGSGDGRIVIAAARRGTRSVGIERRQRLVEDARKNAQNAGVADLTHFVLADAMDIPGTVSQATMVTLYLSPHGVAAMSPWLQEVLAQGTQIASVMFPMPDLRPETVIRVEGTEGNTRGVNIFLYRTRPHSGNDKQARGP